MIDKNPVYSKTVMNKKYKMLFTRRDQVKQINKKGYPTNDSGANLVMRKRKLQAQGHKKST